MTRTITPTAADPVRTGALYSSDVYRAYNSLLDRRNQPTIEGDFARSVEKGEVNPDVYKFETSKLMRAFPCLTHETCWRAVGNLAVECPTFLEMKDGDLHYGLLVTPEPRQYVAVRRVYFGGPDLPARFALARVLYQVATDRPLIDWDLVAAGGYQVDPSTDERRRKYIVGTACFEVGGNWYDLDEQDEIAQRCCRDLVEAALALSPVGIGTTDTP